MTKVEIGEGAESDRLERGARPIRADLGDGFPERVGDHRRDDRSADPALAWPHTAASERLQLVRSGRAQSCRAADLCDRHLLAATGDDLILGGDQYRSRRAVEPIEKRSQRELVVE